MSNFASSGPRLRGGILRCLTALLMAALMSAAVSSWTFGAALTQSARAEAPPLVGFTFSPVSASYYGDTPTTALASLLDSLAPDLVRLPVFWDEVEPAAGRFDFSQVDSLLSVIRRHNRLTPARPTSVVLVVGVRNVGFPEIHVPDWITTDAGLSVPSLVATLDYTLYFRRTVARYANEGLLAAWQVENEALDNVSSPVSGVTAVPAEDLQEDIKVVHDLDRGTPVLVTTYNNSTLSLDLEQISAPNSRRYDKSGATPVGHPLPTLQVADVLGIDAYVATGSTSLSDASVAKRISWKLAALQYWADEARALGKPLWVTEMQGEAWVGEGNFHPADLVRSAQEYRRAGAAVVLLWGVEGWLHDAAWMTAGMQARALLGSQLPASR